MKSKKRELTPEVIAISEMHFKGTLVPHELKDHLRFDSGKLHLVALFVMSEVLYWYRASETKDEATGEVSYHKKFWGDKLHKSYEQLSKELGVTKRQIQDACTFLKKKGFLDVELRTIESPTGVVCSNVSYLLPGG